MRNIISKFKALFRCRSLWIALHSIALAIATYIVWNQPYDWTDGGSFLTKFHLVKNIVAETDTVSKDLALINTSYDHVMIPARDEQGLECGQIDITDRKKLITLFQQLRRDNDYRYIVCDISFDSRYHTPYDHKLFSLIASTPRCIVPALTGVSLPKQLQAKSCISEYGISATNNDFLKYQYLQEGGESTALRMARDIDSIQYIKKGFFYFVDGKLCVNSHVVDIETNVVNEYKPSGEKNIIQLGTEAVPLAEAGVKGIYKDKMVLIGDFFREDIHNTVAGKTAGLMITYNAYQALRTHKNVVSWWFTLVLLVVYGLLTRLVLSRNPDNKSMLEHFLTYILTGCIILFFFLSGTYLDALGLLVYFAFLKWTNKKLRKYVLNRKK